MHRSLVLTSHDVQWILLKVKDGNHLCFRYSLEPIQCELALIGERDIVPWDEERLIGKRAECIALIEVVVVKDALEFLDAEGCWGWVVGGHCGCCKSGGPRPP